MKTATFTVEQARAFNTTKRTLATDVDGGCGEFSRENFQDYLENLCPEIEYTQDQLDYAVITNGM